MKRDISPRQKQYILDNISKKTPDEIAKHLNISVKNVNDLLNSQPAESISPAEELPPMKTIKPHKFITYTLLILGFTALFAFGFVSRMYPHYSQKNYMLDYDYAFHLRMTQSVVDTGKVPELDKLAWYPEGKKVPELLPVILYYLGAGFHYIYNLFKESTAQESIVVFYGIFCSLTMLVVFFLLMTITGKKYISFIGASLAALMPAHLVRTLCTRYRYEGPGILFLLVNITFFIKALETKSNKKFYLYSILASIFMALSVGTWRISLLFPTLYCIVFILLLIMKRTDAKFLGAFSIQAGLLIFCFFYFRFLRSQNYIFSHNALLITGLAITASLTKWWKKKGIVKVDPVYLLMPFFMVAVIPIFHLSSGYESFLSVLVLKIRLAFYDFKITGIENILFLNTAELASIKPIKFFGWDICSFGAIFIILYPISLIFFRDKTKQVSIGEKIVSVFFFTIVLLSVLFYRNKVILSLFTAIVGAISVDRTISFFKKFHWRDKAIPIFLVGVCVITIGSGFKTNTYLKRLRVKMRPHLHSALLNFKRLNTKGEPSLSYWSYGYEIQTYVNAPSYLDGLLESKLVHERLVEMSRLYLKNSEEDFYNFCKKYGLKWFLVDKYSSRTKLYSMYAEYPYYALFDRSGRPTKRGKNTIRAKTTFNPRSLKKFKLLYSNKRFNIFKIL